MLTQFRFAINPGQGWLMESDEQIPDISAETLQPIEGGPLASTTGQLFTRFTGRQKSLVVGIEDTLGR